jgi:DNA polymerase-3 subunit delta'
VAGNDDIAHDEAAPWTNPDLIGHGAAEARFLDSYNDGRVPHAWLLAGPRGIGKATLAYRFARFLLSRSENGPALFADAPDGLAVSPDHQAFHLVANRSHPGLHVVERSADPKTGRMRGEIVVQQIRDLNRFFAMTSASGGWRVAIVDGADEMNPNAANAILKTLEEPPARSVIMLVAHAAGRLLPTIRSRCRVLTLRPLASDDVVAVLLRQMPGLDADAAKSLAELAEGSPGRALALAGQGGLDVYRQLIGLTVRLPQVPYEQVHALGDLLNRREKDQDYRMWTDLLGLWLARNIRRAASGTAAGEVVPGEWSLADRLRQSGNLDRWVDLWENVGRLTVQADGLNLERKQVILNAFMALETTAREQFS